MATKIKPHPNLIGDKWKTSSDTLLEDRNPANYSKIIVFFPIVTLDDTKSAIQAARSVFRAWSRTPTPACGAILAEAKGEVTRARDIFKYYTGEGWCYHGQVLPGSVNDKLLYKRRELLGVVSIITPWNFPIAIPAWKIAPALIYGNMVVFKPAEAAPHTALLLVEALMEAGLPPGIINFLTDDGALIGTEMTSNPNVKGISFTGSPDTGTRVYQNAIKNMARVQLEMGGKNALVILKDANMDLAVKFAINKTIYVSHG